ncbi:hypothetical protein [uncultured Fusobacterium sp.]|uniref:hypothetical protein n=1 Tax=uncultured Fusobacterium sp. TaxID=159267 RepID=UPI0025F1A294|nr:hypothetical protein [uncultured Fusobacterium sp.]MCF2639484.1 hypothetical protein [Fusobacterium varium]
MFKDRFKSEKKIVYITLEEMKRELKSGIIVLENRYFKIEKISLEKGLDEKERELEIEEILEERVDDYNPVEYIEKEIVLREDEEFEEIVIILLKRDIVEEILQEGKEKKIRISGIVPAFFLRSIEIDKNRAELFIDIDEEKVIKIELKDGKIKNIDELEIEKEKILESEVEEILQDLLEIDLTEFEKISFYEKDREIGEIFQEIDNIDVEINNWKENEIEYNYNYDFLPLEYLESLKMRSSIKKKIIIFFTVFILQILLGMIFHYFSNLNVEKIGDLEKNIGVYKDEIEEIREKIIEIEEKEKIREEELKRIEFKNIKLGSLLKNLDEFKPKGVTILNIELNETNKLKILGKSINEEKILKFQEKIVEHSKFKNLNHDYIKREDEIYDFQLEVEVCL